MKKEMKTQLERIIALSFRADIALKNEKDAALCRIYKRHSSIGNVASAILNNRLQFIVDEMEIWNK